MDGTWCNVIRNAAWRQWVEVSVLVSEAVSGMLRWRVRMRTARVPGIQSGLAENSPNPLPPSHPRLSWRHRFNARTLIPSMRPRHQGLSSFRRNKLETANAPGRGKWTRVSIFFYHHFSKIFLRGIQLGAHRLHRLIGKKNRQQVSSLSFLSMEIPRVEYGWPLWVISPGRRGYFAFVLSSLRITSMIRFFPHPEENFAGIMRRRGRRERKFEMIFYYRDSYVSAGIETSRRGIPYSVNADNCPNFSRNRSAWIRRKRFRRDRNWSFEMSGWNDREEKVIIIFLNDLISPDYSNPFGNFILSYQRVDIPLIYSPI